MSQEREPAPRHDQREEHARIIYEFICGFIDEIGYAPSISQIAKACYMSRSTVVRYLDFLEAWGYLWREPGLPRAIVITDKERRL